MNWNIAIMQAANEGGTGGIKGILRKLGEGAIKLVETFTGAEQPTTTVYVDRTNPINVGLFVLLLFVGALAGISIYRNVQYRAIIEDLRKEKEEEKEAAKK